MPKRVFYGKIKDGKLELDNRELMLQCISKTKNMDVEVEIRPVAKDPTVQQWAYLYGSVYSEFANHFGWTIDEVDTWMKKEFMKDNCISLPDGLMLTKTCFDRVWLAKYVDTCIRYAAEQGVAVPPPKFKGI